MIKNKFTKVAKFSFHKVTSVDVRKAIKYIRLEKSSRVVSEKLIVRNMLYLDYFIRDKGRLATQNMLAQCSWMLLGKTSLHLLRGYLSNWKQRTKIGSSFSDWWDIICGIPQESILGPLF